MPEASKSPQPLIRCCCRCHSLAGPPPTCLDTSKLLSCKAVCMQEEAASHPAAASHSADPMFTAASQVPRHLHDPHHDSRRPIFHPQSARGWSSDPCGPIYYKGRCACYFSCFLHVVTYKRAAFVHLNSRRPMFHPSLQKAGALIYGAHSTTRTSSNQWLTHWQ
jgi:hypothetical protein